MTTRTLTTRACTYLDPHHVERCTECGVGLDLCLCPMVNDTAHDRLTSPDGIFLTMVRGELIAARQKFPFPDKTLAALTEELGELAQAMLDHDRDGSKSPHEILREAVQVATMAARVGTEGDETFAYEFPGPPE